MPDDTQQTPNHNEVEFLPFVFEAQVTEKKRFTIWAEDLETAEKHLYALERGELSPDVDIEMEDGYDIWELDDRSITLIDDPREP